MIPSLDEFPLAYITSQTLKLLLKGYNNPHDCISRMVKKGQLIRLKNGFYLIASRVNATSPAPLEQVANLLYGPSYLSLEWALSYYGVIPERAVMITSVTIGKAKEFKTPVGFFKYSHLSLTRYASGIDQMPSSQIGGFLVATPEKALLDYIFLRWKKLDSVSDFIESMRIDLDEINNKKLAELGNMFKNKFIDRFIEKICH